jgi:methionine-rich copper-binding protein CopC
MTIRPVLFVSLLLAAGAASAHAHVRTSEPGDRTTLATAPTKLVVRFNEAVRVAVLTLQKGSDKAVALKPLPKAPVADIDVPLPALAPGAYTVQWRVAGDDGHVTGGTIRFAVAAPKAP